MEELMRQARTIARGMWQYRWPALAVAWIVALASAIVVFKLPDRYEASARVFVDTQSILKPLMSGLAVQPNIDQQVVMLSRTLISRPNVEKLVRMADLDLKTDSKLQREELIEQLTRDLQIRSAARDNLYTLAYQDSDPAKANRVIQSLVSIFVESGLGGSRKDTESAKAFLDEQIRSYRIKLEEAETRLKDFRLRNINIAGADGRDSAAQMADIAAKLEQARLELREAENARAAARRQLDEERGAKGSNTTTQSLLQESSLSVSTPELDARIEAQKRSLDLLLQRFTEQHPDVANTRRLIKDLEDERKKEAEALRKKAMSTPLGVQSGGAGNLAAQELSRLVATAEVQVAALSARVNEYSGRYDQAREALKTAPKLEAEAVQLNRDYAIHKKNYEDLVARREAAIMSGDLEDKSGVADFRLIDPPRVSAQPVWPNRFLLLPLALLAALAAGLLTAFAASQLRPVFHDADALRAKTQLPLLGVVTRVRSALDERRARSNLVRFAAASGSLVGVFAVGLVIMAFMATR
jgi:polysaccharide chain length determinant protein (PEP-CTERM system associated)